MITFEELGIEDFIIRALKENGIEQPFPIQESIIPLILKGEDVIGRSNTGTGKTAAFVLPLLSKIDPKNYLQGLILAPTRELAVQITDTINQFVKYCPIRATAIYGGQNFQIQKKILSRGVNIVVATPGRLLDHISHGTISLNKINFVVLDEADRMLDMGFVEDIKDILSYIKSDKQICLFSATMPDSIIQLAKEYMKNPKQINIEKTISQTNINQSYLLLYDKDKFKQLVNTLKPISTNKDTHVIVFAATKQRCRELTFKLKDENFYVESIHGDLNQRQRENTLSRFRNKKFNILIATDVASRGLDITTVSHIINYDLPDDVETYFHRIGRTARAGAQGTSLSFVSQSDMFTLRKIQNITKNSLKNLNTELGIEVDFKDIAGSPRNNRYRSNQRRDYGGGGGGRDNYGRNRFQSGGEYRPRNRSYNDRGSSGGGGGGYGSSGGGGGYGHRRDRDNDGYDGYGYGRNGGRDNRYHANLKGITKPLGRKDNTNEYSDK
ncbi:MAG TPA: DEAD/DEAH box helicase [Candidatus Nitrosocosmicus sp.]